MGNKCFCRKKDADTVADTGINGERSTYTSSKTVQLTTGSTPPDEDIISRETQTVENDDGTVTTTEVIRYKGGRTLTKKTTTGTVRVVREISGLTTTVVNDVKKGGSPKTKKPDLFSKFTSKGAWTQFEKEALDEHNKLRAKHGAPPLKLNKQLCGLATEWAQHLASKNTLEHRKNNEYGENCYMTTGGDIDGATAVKAWYDEIKDYNFRSGGFSMGTGHFTQVVWKNSKELGIGFGKSSSGGTYVVANYDPAGNFQGQYKENVLSLQ